MALDFPEVMDGELCTKKPGSHHCRLFCKALFCKTTANLNAMLAIIGWPGYHCRTGFNADFRYRIERAQQ
jgi:hypothetical protein